MEKIKIFDTFTGVGGFSIALEESIGKENVKHIGFSEIEKTPIKVLNKRYPGIINFGDITKINIEKLPDFDLLTGGIPCQPFSTAGKQLGKKDPRGGVMWEAYINILKKKKPKYFIIENVKGLVGKKFKIFFEEILKEIEEIGYNIKYKVLDTRNFGIPQIRTRVFIVGSLGKLDNFIFTEKIEKKYNILDFLEKEVESKKYLTAEEIEIAKEKKKAKFFKNTGSRNGAVALTRNKLNYFLELTKTSFGKTSRQTNLIEDKKGIRILTGSEYEILQGFKKGYVSNILPEYLVKEVMGNSISIPVVKTIFDNLLKCIKK